MNVIIVPEIAVWGASGLRADDFRDIVKALVDSGHIVRSRRDLVFRNIKTLALFTGRPRRRK